MPAPKIKLIRHLLGNPVASSTPIKHFCAMIPEKNANSKSKTQQETYSGPNKLSKTGDHQPKSVCLNGSLNRLEIVTSDSESDIIPVKRAKKATPQAIQLGLRKLTPSVEDIEKKGTTRQKSHHIENQADIVERHERSKLRLRSKDCVKKSDSKQKDTSASKSSLKISEKNSSVNLSSASRKLFQDDDTQNKSKKTTTPVAPIPPAPPRHSLSRTQSRITHSESEKFMVEIPKSLADSFSDSLQLIKRRINFENVNEPENEKEIRKEILESPSKSKTVPHVGRKLLKLTEISSKEQQNTPNSAGKGTKRNRKLAREGVRKSSRTKVPPIPFWLGENANCKDTFFFLQPPKKQRRVSLTHSKRQSPQNNTRQTKSQNVDVVKNGVKQKGKPERSKSVSWNDKEDISIKANNVGQMKACFSTFNEADFCSDGEGEESGVLRATSLQTFDMQSEFIRLLAGAKTGDLMSQNHNQLYTVLENTVCLSTEGELKNVDLHTQFYVCKGVTHQLLNKSSKASLLQQVRIRK